jgi:hypothetical protein
MSRAAQWTAAWVDAAGLGVANGVACDLLYKDRVGDLAAHQISTRTPIAALAGYSRAVERPMADPDHALGADDRRNLAVVDGLRVPFRLPPRRRVVGRPLVRNHDARKGRIWGLVPISMAVLPAVVRALPAKRSEEKAHARGRVPARST